MKKHFVRAFGAAVLTASSLVVVAAQPASALRYFVHGNVHCQITSGSVAYAPTLRETVSLTTRFRIKGTLNCLGPGLQGETGLDDGTIVTGGTFKALSNYYSGTCSSGAPDEMEMMIHWNAQGPSRVRNTEVSWGWDSAHDSAQSDPAYGLSFVGGSVTNLGISGSYLGATAAVSFISGLGTPADPGVNSSACHNATGTGRLKNGWTLDPAGLSELTFQSAPWISQDGLSPSSAVLGTQNLDVNITGQDFAAGDAVSFSGSGITVNSTTFVNENQLTANISIDPGALAGTRDVTVTDATLGSNTCGSCFMVSPIVSGVSPATAGQGATNRNITITGQGFENGAIAQFGAPGSAIATNYTQFIDANTLIANITVANGAPLTTYDVTVIDPGFGVGTCTGCFSVNSGPTVTGTSPSARGGGATNQTISINGTGFANGATVAFGGSGVSVGAVSYVDPTLLMATVSVAPGSTTGTRSVTVVNPDGGQGSCAACFTVDKTPTVTLWQVGTNGKHTINPNADPQGRRDRDVYTVDVTITGTNFQPGVVVTYPGAATTTFIVNSQTYVSATKIKQNITIDYGDFSQLQPNPPDRTIIVTNPDGGTYSLPGAVILVG
jgi:hypothetical protein